MNASSDYDVRSLQHERRMLELYRKGAASDGALLQPLANACWRAAAFEWRVHEDVATVRSLWEEAARALAEGFVRKRGGFEQTPEQLILALHFSIAAQAVDVSKTLAHATAASPSNLRGPRLARTSLLLLDGYQWVLRALIEGKSELARAAQRSLAEARAPSDPDGRQLPLVGEAAWRVAEHETTRALLSIIAGVLETMPSTPADLRSVVCDRATTEFSSLMDAALLDLSRFIETEANHRPKLYCWLPGISLGVLAARAGFSFDWLDVRHQSSERDYSRLPSKLVQQAEVLHAQASSL